MKRQMILCNDQCWASWAKENYIGMFLKTTLAFHDDSLLWALQFPLPGQCSITWTCWKVLRGVRGSYSWWCHVPPSRCPLKQSDKVLLNCLCVSSKSQQHHSSFMCEDSISSRKSYLNWDGLSFKVNADSLFALHSHLCACYAKKKMTVHICLWLLT